METHDSATFDILSVIFKQPITLLLLLLLNHTITGTLVVVFSIPNFKITFAGAVKAVLKVQEF